MLQVRAGKDWGHRVYWGEDKIPYGKIGSEGPDHRRAGDLPELGKWVRLEAPVEQIGIGEKEKVTGMAFTQFGGNAWWDDAGVSKERALPGEIVEDF